MLMNSMAVLALLPDPGDGGSGPPVSAPLDGGAAALLVAWAAIAVTKLVR